MRGPRLPPPEATCAEVDAFLENLRKERQARRDSDAEVYSVRVGSPTAKRKPWRLSWAAALGWVNHFRLAGLWARPVFVRPKEKVPAPLPPPKEYRVRTRFGQVGTLREQNRGSGKGYQIEFQPDVGGAPISFVGTVWSRGTEEDSVRMGLDEQHVVPMTHARWTTWEADDGALFTYERLEETTDAA